MVWSPGLPVHVGLNAILGWNAHIKVKKKSCRKKSLERVIATLLCSRMFEAYR